MNVLHPAFPLIIGQVLLLVMVPEARAQRVRFKPRDGTAVEVWQISHDATVRDTANYHNTQCWSHDGRYIGYTHYASNGEEFGTRPAAEVHLFELQHDRDLNLDRGVSPRWANQQPWLFYLRVRPEEPHEREEQVMWLDLDSGKRTRIAYDVGQLKETDCKDRWIYAERSIDGRRRAIRIPIEVGAEAEVLPGDWGVGYNSLNVNPVHPLIVSRDHNFENYHFATPGTRDIAFVARHFIDHDLAGELPMNRFERPADSRSPARVATRPRPLNGRGWKVNRVFRSMSTARPLSES